jgi:hypothetical protein
MRHTLAVVLAGLIPLSAAAQVVSFGWSDLLGKTCVIRYSRTQLIGVAATFRQSNDGSYVDLKATSLAGATTSKVTFAPPDGMTFDQLGGAGQFVLLYNDQNKTWSGTLTGGGGLPATLTCSP